MPRSVRSVPWGHEGVSAGGRLRRPSRLAIAILISSSIVSTLFLAATGMGATLTVAPGERIQAALDEARSGDAVLVEGGVYRERLVVSEGIALQGSGRPQIDAGGSGSGVTLQGEGARIQGFLVTGSGSEEMDAGVRVLGEGCTVEDNHLSGNRIGILLQSVTGGAIRNNSVEGNGIGILLERSWDNEIAGNRIAENGVGIKAVRQNASESIKASDSGGVSIKYRPKTEAATLEVSKIGFAGGLKENRIYGNELLDNGENALDDGENRWDDGRGGNHFDDFDAIEEGCKDRDRDGLCDAPRKIPGGPSVDERPIASEDAVRKYAASAGDFKLFLYRSTFSPGAEMPLCFAAPENFTGRAVLAAPSPGSGPMTGEAGTGPKTDMETDTETDKEPIGVALSSQPLAGRSGTVTFTAPEGEGSYVLRMEDGSGSEVVSLPFAVATPEVKVANASAGTCDRVNVSYSGAPGFEGDWIGLYPVGAGDDRPISREYLDGTSRGTLPFVIPSSAGSYEFRMFEDDGFTRIAVSQPIEVAVSAGVRVEASPAAARPGEAITVSFWGAKPASAIGMYEMTRPDKYMIGMQWTNGRACGTMTFAAPRTPGRYDFRLFEDNVHRKLMGASNVVVVG